MSVKRISELNEQTTFNADGLLAIVVNGVTMKIKASTLNKILSVNGYTGAVVLDAEDVGALPDDTTYIAEAEIVSGKLKLTDSEGNIIEYEGGAVKSVNGKTGEVVLNASDVGALPDDTPIPTKTSDLTNDSGFITNAVSTLLNYYLKSETYTKAEVQTLIDAIKQFTYEVVAVLPSASASTMNKIYLVPSSSSTAQNVKDEFITIDNGAEAETRYVWEQIGTTAIDLSNYYTKAQTDTAIAGHHDSSKQDALTAGANVSIENNTISADQKFVVNVTESGSTVTADKTFAEIISAHSNGKIIEAVCEDIIYPMIYVSNGSCVFTIASTDKQILGLIVDNNNAWIKGAIDLYQKPASGIPKTDLASAVQTSLDKANASQPASDNTLQTTAKTVVGAINEHEGDISTLNSELVNLDNAKVDKVQGKGLSTNDFDNNEKAKADGAVRFDTAMGLTDAQKLQARANIGILATLTVNCKPSEVGDSTVLSGVAVTIKDGGDNTIASGTFNGTALTFPLPINQQYKVVVSATVSIGGVVYFNPQGVGSEGAMTTDKTVVMEYASTRNIQTMADVKTFLALDLPIETKRNALVSSETNSFTFNVDLYENGTEVAKTATMPMRVLEVDTYEQMVDGETVSFVGAKCQPIYTVTDKTFDQREQVETSAGETFSADLRYFTATTGGVGDKVFTMLNAGTDYQVGDDIDTYKTAHNVFVYKNGLRNNSNQLSADVNMVRYGSNITHLSNVHKWLNGEGLDWFEPSYVGDICNYSGTLGYKSWFKSDVLSLIRDNVAWGVYERSGYELPNNKMYCMFALPSVTEFAGSGNSYEGTVTEYWKYLNGGAISNAANATRTIKNSGGTNKHMWFRSPSRSYSCYPWYLSTSGRCDYGDSAYISYGVAPLFII